MVVDVHVVICARNVETVAEDGLRIGRKILQSTQKTNAKFVAHAQNQSRQLQQQLSLQQLGQSEHGQP